MGLNLPINRVIFSTLEKYDGVSERCLKSIEVKQIAGRAGRAQCEGHTTVLVESNNHSDFIEACLSIKENNISIFPIMPNTWHVSKIKDILRTNFIENILEVFPKLCDSRDFYSTIKSDILTIAGIVDKKFKIPAEEKLKFCLTPVDMRVSQQVDTFLEIIEIAFVNDRKMRYSEHFNLYEYNYSDLEWAEQELKCISILCYLAQFTNNISLDGIEKSKKILNSFIIRALLKVKVPEDYRHYRDYCDDDDEDGYY